MSKLTPPTAPTVMAFRWREYLTCAAVIFALGWVSGWGLYWLVMWAAAIGERLGL